MVSLHLSAVSFFMLEQSCLWPVNCAQHNNFQTSNQSISMPGSKEELS